MERFQQIRDFREEKFWKIEMKYQTVKEEAKFTWARLHLFNRECCEALFERCEDAEFA